MLTEIDFYLNELTKIQNRIKNLEYRKDYSNTRTELETILTKIGCLKSIEDFLQKML